MPPILSASFRKLLRKYRIAIFGSGGFLVLLVGLAFYTNSPSVSVTPIASIPVGRIPSDQDSLLEIGTGFDSLSGQVRAHCIVETKESLPKPSENSSYGSMKLDAVESREELAKALRVSVNASYEGGAYSGSASVNYQSSEKMNSYSSYLVVSTFSENEPQQLVDYHLTGEARAALRKGFRDFVNLCGDQYVRGQITGGDVSALLSIFSSTQKEQSDVEGVVRAAGYGGKVDASMSQSLESFRQQKRLHMEMLRHGPAETIPQADIDSIIKYAQTFPQKVARNSGNAWTIAYLVAPYKEAYQSWKVLPEQAQFLRNEQPYLQALYTARNNLAYVQQYPDQFGTTSSTKLSAKIAELETTIRNVKPAIDDCLANSSKCKALSHIPIPPTPGRGNNWISMDPIQFDYHTYFTVVGPDIKVMEITGRWYTNAAAKAGIYGSTQWQVKLTSTKDGHTIFEGAYPGTPMKIPIDTYVNIHVIDINEPSARDNGPVDNDPPKVRLFTPVFADDY